MKLDVDCHVERFSSVVFTSVYCYATEKGLAKMQQLHAHKPVAVRKQYAIISVLIRATRHIRAKNKLLVRQRLLSLALASTKNKLSNA